METVDWDPRRPGMAETVIAHLNEMVPNLYIHAHYTKDLRWDGKDVAWNHDLPDAPDDEGYVPFKVWVEAELDLPRSNEFGAGHYMGVIYEPMGGPFDPDMKGRFLPLLLVALEDLRKKLRKKYRPSIEKALAYVREMNQEMGKNSGRKYAE